MTPRLPQISADLRWFLIDVEIAPVPGQPNQFFDGTDGPVAGAFTAILAPADSFAQAELIAQEYVSDLGARLVAISRMSHIETLDDLPVDDDGDIDEALSEDLSDPTFGENVTHGMLYLYPPEDFKLN